jgi:hypothetical protein
MLDEIKFKIVLERKYLMKENLNVKCIKNTCHSQIYKKNSFYLHVYFIYFIVF